MTFVSSFFETLIVVFDGLSILVENNSLKLIFSGLSMLLVSSLGFTLGFFRLYNKNLMREII